eukprot:1539524-Pyramimonas_sp.AAC.1
MGVTWPMHRPFEVPITVDIHSARATRDNNATFERRPWAVTHRPYIVVGTRMRMRMRMQRCGGHPRPGPWRAVGLAEKLVWDTRERGRDS